MLKSTPAKLRLAIAGRSADTLRELAALLHDEPRVQVTTRLTVDRSLQKLRSDAEHLDVVIVSCSDEELVDLDDLAALEPGVRPEVIACGTLTTPAANRAVIRAGATDLLPARPQRAELIAALERVIARAAAAGTAMGHGDLITVIGAAGGVGATFLTCNLAHLSASNGGRALLVDLDVAYSPMAGILGLTPERGLLEALQEWSTLDATALEGYITRHESGLGLLAGTGGVWPHEKIDIERFRQLLQLLVRNQGHVFVEGNRWLDGPTLAVLESSRHVLIVLMQSVMQARNAARLYRLLWQQCAVPRERITVVLNRHSAHSPVQHDMVRRAIGCDEPFVIPEFRDLALDSFDSGIPVFELDRSSELSHALTRLGQQLGTSNHNAPASLLRRAVAFLAGKRL